MARRWTFLVGCLLAAMAIAACGGSAPSGGPAGTQGSAATAAPGSTSGGTVASGDPCSLLSADEVWSIMNSDPLVADGNTPGVCKYLTGPLDAAALIMWNTSGGESILKGTRSNPSYEMVDGIGDEALRDGAHLIFRLGDQLFEVLPQWSSGPEREVQAIVMAKVIIARVTGQPVPDGLIPTPPPVLSSKDPCELLSVEEAGAVLGTGPLTSRNNDTGATNQPLFCFYSLADGTAALTTFLDPKGGFDEFDTLVASLEAEPVEGLGNKAVFEAYQGTLYVLKGDTIFTVTVHTVAPETALAPDRLLMEIILSHL